MCCEAHGKAEAAAMKAKDETVALTRQGERSYFHRDAASTPSHTNAVTNSNN